MATNPENLAPIATVTPLRVLWGALWRSSSEKRDSSCVKLFAVELLYRRLF